MKIVSTTNAPSAIGPYSQAIISGGMVYTSGQIAIDPQSGNISATTRADPQSMPKRKGSVGSKRLFVG